MFEFRIKHSDKKTLARTGIFKTPHGEIKTPVFMPVATKATVKTLSSQDLVNFGTDIILANTYHLFLPPREKIIRHGAGLFKRMNRNNRN